MGWNRIVLGAFTALSIGGMFAATAHADQLASADAARYQLQLSAPHSPALESGPTRSAPMFEAPTLVEPQLEQQYTQVGRAPSTSNGFVSDIDMRFRVQPLGLILSGRFYNQLTYMRNNVGVLFNPVYFRAGAVVNLSPAFAEAGIDLEWSPIRVFNLRATYTAGYIFGSLYYIYSFDNITPPNRDGDLADAVERGELTEEAGFNHRLEVSPTIQMALGNIAFRNTFTYMYSHYGSGQFDGPFVRESWMDRLQRVDGDHIVVNTIMLLYKVWDPDYDRDGQMMIGPFHEWTRATSIDGDRRHRVGLTYVYIPRHNWGNYYRPRLLLQGGYNVVDRENNRQGNLFVQGSLGFTLYGRQSR